MTKFKIQLATSAAMLTACAATSAGAQAAPPSEQSRSNPATPVAPDAGQGAARGEAAQAAAAPQPQTQDQTPAQVPADQLQDIIVTAQKVESNVQRVPISVQAVSGDALLKSGVQNARDLQRFVPGLQVTATGPGGSSFFIRGVGNLNELPNADSGLAIDLDQVFFSRAYGPDLALYDLERVEVLKGPQGTLYGRNATGGTINIVTRKPVLGTASGDFAVEIGDYNAIRVNGGYNLPLGSTVALRAAFQVNKHSGYLHDGYDDANTKAARLHLLWKPTDRVSLLLTGEYLNNDSNGPGIVPYDNHQFITADPYEGGGSPAVRAYVLARNPGPNVGLPANVAYPAGSCLPGCLPGGLAPTTPGPYQVDQNGFVKVGVTSLRGVLDWNLGFATLTVVPGYLHTTYRNKYFKGPTFVYNDSSADQESGEVRLASPSGGRLGWIVGLFYFHEKQNYTTFNGATFPTALTYGFNPDFRSTNKSAFAQANYEVLPNLKFTLGGRHTIEDKVSYDNIAGSGNYVPGPPPTQAITPYSSAHFSANTYRVGLDWQVKPANLLYGYVATGYHAGGFNNGSAVTRPLCTPNPNGAVLSDFNNCDLPYEYKPERLTAFAIGSKNRFFGNRLQLNIEAYYWKYRDLQVSHLGLTNPSTSSFRTDNAGSASIKGVDAELSWLVTPNDLLTVNANYNHSRYGELLYYNVIPGRSVTTTNLNGRPFVNAPNFVSAFAYEHTLHLASGATIVPSINGKYQTTVIYGYLPAGQTTDVYQSAYVKLDANLTFNTADRNLSFGLFVRNLTDKTTLLSTSGGNTPGTNSPWTSLAPPRTYGVNLRARF